MKSFANKVAVITGAASGIGRALAVALAEAGCHLALADINETGLAETKALVSNPDHCSIHLLDVSDRKGVYAFAEEVVEIHRQVDIVINNAGVAIANTEARDLRYQDFEWLMGINFWGMVYGSKAFLPYLLRQKQSWLLNVSSIFGIIGFPTQSAYNSSKFAIRGFTEALRQELEGHPICVSCVHPGGIDTGIVHNARGFQNKAEREEGKREFKKLAKTTPEKAARVILRGMKKRKNRILIGADARILDRIQRWFPVSYPRLLNMMGSKEQWEKQKARAATQSP